MRKTLQENLGKTYHCLNHDFSSHNEAHQWVGISRVHILDVRAQGIDTVTLDRMVIDK